jgi:hypothetical protein
MRGQICAPIDSRGLHRTRTNQTAELRLYKSIATMDRKAPLPKLPDQTPTWAKAAALARTWQLDALADRLDLADCAGAPSTRVDKSSLTRRSRSSKQKPGMSSRKK